MQSDIMEDLKIKFFGLINKQASPFTYTPSEYHNTPSISAASFVALLEVRLYHNSEVMCTVEFDISLSKRHYVTSYLRN